MSDSFHSLTVVLASDIKDEDCEPLISAIMQIRGVIGVAPIVADFNSHMAHERAKRELGDKLWEVLYPKRTD